MTPGIVQWGVLEYRFSSQRCSLGFAFSLVSGQLGFLFGDNSLEPLNRSVVVSLWDRPGWKIVKEKKMSPKHWKWAWEIWGISFGSEGPPWQREWYGQGHGDFNFVKPLVHRAHPEMDLHNKRAFDCIFHGSCWEKAAEAHKPHFT